MAEAFSRSALKVSIAQIAQTIGWNSIQTTPLDLLVDILHRYLEELGRTTHRYSEQFGRTEPNLDDLALTFKDLGTNLHDLEEYINYVEAVPFVHEVPAYPIRRNTILNFLKPGSREVVHRPVHVHEHLPPMYPEMEEEDYVGNSISMDTPTTSSGPSPVSSPRSGLFKRPSDPVDTPAAKRQRMMLEEEGRPLREISSVMMTTSGFLSPAREGKLPESRTPLQTTDSRSSSPQPGSYPMVPPEVNTKKPKKTSIKKIIQGVKKFDKENKKKVIVKKKPKIIKKDGERIEVQEDSAVKKLVNEKETSKLKPLKSGALKFMTKKVPKFGGPKLPRPVKSGYPSSNPKIVKPRIPKIPKPRSPKIFKGHSNKGSNPGGILPRNPKSPSQSENLKTKNPKSGKVKTEKPKLENEKGEKSKVEKPKTEKLKVEKTKGEKSKSDKVKVVKPKVERIKTEKVKAEKLKVDKPKLEKPLDSLGISVVKPETQNLKETNSEIVTKLSSDTDNKQKLNIFRKFSKVKDEKSEKEKVEKFEKLDTAEVPPQDSRESSPGLVIDEQAMLKRDKETRLAQIDAVMELVIQRGIEETEKNPQEEPKPKPVKEKVETPKVSKEKSEMTLIKEKASDHADRLLKIDGVIDDVLAYSLPSPKDIYSFDDNVDFSPPRTPSTPKTPEIPILSKKFERTPIVEKKKGREKRDNSKVKKESKSKSPKGAQIMRKVKPELKDEPLDLSAETPERPKTPEVVTTPSPREIPRRGGREEPPHPIFPFLQHFSGPGLLPPLNPLFSRFPLYGFPGIPSPFPRNPNAPHPAMPNLPLPPPFFMQPRPESLPHPKSPISIEPPETAKEKLLDRPPTPTCRESPVHFSVRPEKARSPNIPISAIEKSPEKTEKRTKEHRKEKREKEKEKEKDKLKKREKKRDKDKGEKKKEKGEKGEKKEKEKQKNEKKERRKEKKDKERDEKPESTVPRLTLKFGGAPAAPVQSTPEPHASSTAAPKIVIKPMTKKADKIEEKPASSDSSDICEVRAPSPELVGFSALITRPPKQKIAPPKISPPKTSRTKAETKPEIETEPESALLPVPAAALLTSPTPPSEKNLQPEPAPPSKTRAHPAGKPKMGKTMKATPRGRKKETPSAVVPPAFELTPVMTPSASPVKSTVSTPKPAAQAKGKKSGDGILITETVGHYVDSGGNMVWICPACGSQDDGSPMIGCDECDDWYHWVCVGIQVPPDDSEDWYCRRCIVKKQKTETDRKKKNKKGKKL